jgi:hypothetical protein
MRREGTEKLLLVGYGEDLALLLPRLLSISPETLVLTEEASDHDIPTASGRIVFVMSLNTCYSTQMRSLVECVLDRVAAREKYLLLVGEFDADRFVFPEIRHLQRTSIEDLASRIEASGHSNL